MTIATIGNDVAVMSGTIRMPRVGRWTADFHVDSEEPIEGAVSITFGDGTTYNGFAVRQDPRYGENRVRIVGGAGGLDTVLTPKHYKGPTIGEVLADVVGEASEVVALDSDRSILDTAFDFWTTIPVPAGRMIAELMKHAPEGAVWRVRPDGQIWFGFDTFEDPELEEVFDESRNGAQGILEISLDFPTLQPGISIDDREVDYIEHRIDDSNVHATLWLRDEDGTSKLDRVKEHQHSTARAALPIPTYFAVYPCQLVKQPTDFTVDVNPIAPIDATLPPLSGIPLRVGIPGAIVRVSPGAVVLIGWENGDPTAPFAALWGAGAGAIDVVFKATKVQIGGDALNPVTDGALNGTAVDPYTGLQHWQLGNASVVTFVKK